MNSLAQKIHSFSRDIFHEIKQIREHLHQHPELSFQELKTSKFLKSKLEEWGLKVDREWVNTGFTVVIDSGQKGPTVGIRADLDALPIEELNEVPYASVNKGIMHACGHDVHASCLMGLARVLSHLKTEFKGKAVLIFQPGEEKLPGGASQMINEGLLEAYNFDLILAQHVYPELEHGEVGFRPGMYMASADEIYITIKGKGGHAALPHNNIDPIVIASSVILSLQQLVSRSAPPTVPTVLSFGKIEGLGATNVIPSEVKIEGTLRTMDEHWRKIFHEKIKTTVEHTSEALGGSSVCEVKVGYPFLCNDEEATKESTLMAQEYLDKEHVIELPLRMTAEDFAYFSQKTKVCFYRLGVGNEKLGITHSVHHPRFDIDANALQTGVGLLSYLTIRHLTR